MNNYDITHDLATTRTQQAPTFKQFDKGQTITITLLDGGQPVDFEDMSVMAFFRLPNGATEQKECEVVNEKIVAELEGKLLLRTGYVQIEFKLYNKDLSTVKTFTLGYYVDSSVNMTVSGGAASGGTGGSTIPSPIVTTDPTKKKYVILAFAGQSNSVGYDESKIDPLFDGKTHPRIKQLGLYDPDNLKPIPLTYCAQNLQNMEALKTGVDRTGTKGLHLPLAKLVLKHIPDDYELLVISAAYGGTAFTQGTGNGSYNTTDLRPNNYSPLPRWGENSAFYLTLRDRIERVLSWNEDNYFMGLVWMQGEHDRKNAAGHKQGFETMMDAFFNHFNNSPYKTRVKGGEWSREQVYMHDTTPTWTTRQEMVNGQNTNQFAQITANYKEWCREFDTYTVLTYPKADSRLYTNETGGAPKTAGGVQYGSTTADQPTHFGNNAFRKIVAPQVYNKMLQNGLFDF